MALDKTDKKILEELQLNSQLSNQDLADLISLSPSPCLRRVKQLEANKVIKKYVALVDEKKVGLELTIMISIGLESHDPKIMSNFEEKVRCFPEVIQCYLIAGQDQDYMLRVVSKDLADYQSFLLKKLTQVAGIKSVHSSFVLQKIIDNTRLPIN